jgi:hypothetical protein
VAIFPPFPFIELGPYFGFLSALVLLVGNGWIALGKLLARSSGWLTPFRIFRIAAGVLAAFALLLTGAALQSIL